MDFTQKIPTYHQYCLNAMTNVLHLPEFLMREGDGDVVGDQGDDRRGGHRRRRRCRPDRSGPAGPGHRRRQPGDSSGDDFGSAGPTGSAGPARRRVGGASRHQGGRRVLRPRHIRV